VALRIYTGRLKIDPLLVNTDAPPSSTGGETVGDTMLRTITAILVILASTGAHSAPLVPGPIKKKILITRFAAGSIVCRGPNIDYRHVASMENMIELFYYEHDAKRIWMKAGGTKMLGYDVSCEMSGAESSDLP
jgi:hypothetical protein